MPCHVIIALSLPVPSLTPGGRAGGGRGGAHDGGGAHHLAHLRAQGAGGGHSQAHRRLHDRHQASLLIIYRTYAYYSSLDAPYDSLKLYTIPLACVLTASSSLRSYMMISYNVANSMLPEALKVRVDKTSYSVQTSYMSPVYVDYSWKTLAHRLSAAERRWYVAYCF